MTGALDVLGPPAWRASLGRPVGVSIFRTLYRGRARHPERVPRTGPVILVANHASYLDGPLVFSLCPRPASFLVKQEAFSGVFGWVVRTVGQIPIDRSVGDRRALACASAVLARGGVVGIFPEGTRTDGDVDEVNRGASWIALRSGAPLVPVAVLGTRVQGQSTDAWPRPRSVLTVDFGEPFRLDADASVPGRERLRLASEQVRDVLGAHVRRARMGEWSGNTAP
jgi:1-acyl-sn-glycerol-3-phosphate acyltransferase